jgi:hypothetical protein
MKLFAPLAVAAALMAAAPADAAIVLIDDFSTYGSSTVLNAPDSVFGGTWFTTDGTVDYIADGDIYSDLCLGASGSCVDLDGSTGNAGVFSSLLIGPGTYNVLFQLTGNLRGGSDELTISFGNVVRTVTLAWNEVVNQNSFGLDFFGIDVGPGGTTLSFSTAGGDNMGPLLKSVVIETAPATVPLPAGGGLLLGALALMGMARRRKV